MSDDAYPLHASAVVLPILAFPAWILCILPMVWHFKQRNIAAGSLIIWMSALNFFNSINPLIWPRDNMDEWWNGAGLCDIQVRVQVGAVVALSSCAAVIARRLANVMDTSNITVSPSKRSVILEKIIEITACWVFPIIFMITYYIVQPFRYFIFGISGCVAAYDASWPSLVVVWIWGCITTLVAAFYAGLLGFRLYHYRREFHRLIAARNTTKSRFMRLFLIAMIIVLLLLPYSFFLLYSLATAIVDDYSWAAVHGPDWNSFVKVPAYGVVRFDRWGEVASGYLIFILFGTGSDANNTYSRMLCSVGFGRVFPSLYETGESPAPTLSSVTFSKRLTESWSSKARSLFSKNGSVAETSHSGSIVETLHPVATNEPSFSSPKGNGNISFFNRLFKRRSDERALLPVYNHGDALRLDKAPAELASPGNYARAWAGDDNATEANATADIDKIATNGVHVVREVHQARQDTGNGVAATTQRHAWA